MHARCADRAGARRGTRVTDVRTAATHVLDGVLIVSGAVMPALVLKPSVGVALAVLIGLAPFLLIAGLIAVAPFVGHHRLRIGLVVFELHSPNRDWRDDLRRLRKRGSPPG